MQKYLQNLTPLKNQGFCNKVYLSRYKNQKFIVKKRLNKKVDTRSEAKAQNLAYKKKISAKIITFDRQYIVYEYIEGEHKKKLTKKDLNHLLRSLKNLHKINLRSKRVNPKELLPRSEHRVLAKIQNYKEDLLTTHNDLNPKNILFCKNGVKFIDFEYCRKWDIYFDLAAISVEFDLKKEDENYFLKRYFGKYKADRKKLKLFKDLYKKSVEHWFKINI